jgi:hypothetical protein
MGDKVLAFFRADDVPAPELAARLDAFLRAWREAERRGELPFPVSVGLNAGTVICGLLGAEARQLLFREQVRADKAAFALGWFIQERDGRRFYSHRGGGLGYVSEVRLYPEAGLGSVLLVNMTTPAKGLSPDLLDAEYLR